MSDSSVADMAEYVGVTRETFSRYLNGRQDAPLAVVRLVGMRTGVPVQWLLNGETPAGPRPDGGGDVRPEGFEPPTFCSQGQNAQASDLTAPRLVAVSSQAAA